MSEPSNGGIAALLGPTNTGKTHRAVERLLEHQTGMIGLPLRLLAREVYDRVTARVGERPVALITGEEKRIPSAPRYWITTVESMPIERDVDFVCVDEIQMAAHRKRGHTFTDRLLHLRGLKETWFLGAETIQACLEEVVPTASVHRFPRFSRLSYVGQRTVSGLPPRSAVVAFSMQDVYSLAERIRQRHGGTAVVLGALSPRTRNAQVAMYEAGEVQYMVATDAIGMGLNLDLDTVVFAATTKFDGRDVRTLYPSELGQIAGRAGRYTRDGGFGVLKPGPALDDRVVHQIEGHRFEPIRRLQWRNSDLDLSSVEALLESLRARPRQPALRLTEQAEDHEALLQLGRREDVQGLARGPERVALLWDVCRIPDFRKLLEGSHVQLLAEIYQQLCRPSACLDVDWMARRIAQLDHTEGGIDALIHRMSFIRTWTYITHHEAWIRDAEHWQARTRAIEDRQSDALHDRLTERFVDRSGGRTMRGRSHRRARTPSPASPSPVKPDANHPFHQLAGLKLADHESDEGPDDEGWVQALVDAEHDAFGIDAEFQLQFRDRPVATLKRGPDMLRPHVVALGDSVEGAGAQQRVSRRLTAWCRDAVEDLLEPANTASQRSQSAAMRGLAYQLRQGLGVVVRRGARKQWVALTHMHKAELATLGIVVGSMGALIERAMRPPAIRLRSALWCTWHGLKACPVNPAAMVCSPTGSIGDETLAELGFVVCGDRLVRLDVLHQIDGELERRAGRGLGLDGAVFDGLDLSLDALLEIVEALGYRRTAHGWVRPRSRSRSK